jgi:hypothetical protein
VARLAPMLYDGRTKDGLPVHSFHDLLADLATLTRNTVVTALAPTILSPSPPAPPRRPSTSSASPLPVPGNHPAYEPTSRRIKGLHSLEEGSSD